MNDRRVIAVSGTPATGKSAFAVKLAEDEDYTLIDLNEVIEGEDIYELDPEGTRIVDPKDLRRVFDEILSEGGEDIVVDGLLSHLLSPQQVSGVVVLRTNPEVLENRLKEREYSDEKLEENLEAEALGVILGEAVQEHGEERVYEIDTTHRSPSEAVDMFRKALDGREDLSPGSIDWLEEYLGIGDKL